MKVATLGSECSGYRMIKTVTIKNFRSFASAKISNMRRINVVVGNNASGKTALLEAIFLAAGASPEMAFKLRTWRNQEVFNISNEQNSYDALWTDFFHMFDQRSKIDISLIDSHGDQRKLEIKFQDVGADLFLPLTGSSQFSQPQPVVPIEFKWKVHGKEYVSVPEIDNHGLKLRATQLAPIAALFYSTATQNLNQQYAQFFSALSAKKLEKDVIELIRKEFKFIENIEVLIKDGIPTLHATVQLLPEKVPLYLLSDGVNKLINILLGIAMFPKGIIIIDEIENGLYFERMPSVWRSIHAFARKYDVQIIASTHSAECLRALRDALSSTPDDALLIRTMIENGVTSTEQFLGSSFFKALEMGEVR
ncbi:ATP/GTP-binding protein [Hyphomicrobium sp.]|jgi:AAA15 family ATPase/GTPase|uniref:AAA family ATPase n=1 Tax=Hyphomicrobium sp. TaxID=82 RepID=UPI00356AACBE